MLDLLRRRAGGRKKDTRTPGDLEYESLTIGKFGQATVSLVGDDEFRDRCFLVIGPRARSGMRLTLAGEDIVRLAESLAQVAEDLPRGRIAPPR